MKKISFRDDVLPLKDVLFRLALRITLSREEAEDIVQDTLIKVWNKRESWQDLDSIEAFSLTVCRNLSLDRIKLGSNNNASLDQSNADKPAATLNPLERMQQKDSIRIVKRIIDGLPEKQRSCIQLRDIEGKQYKEIAQILDISEDQVKVNIFRARQAVRQQYLKYDEYGL